MSKDFIQILKGISEEKKEYFENYQIFCKKIKEEAKNILGVTKVLVFGSIIRGEFTPKSDIDILIISENLPKMWEERNMIRTKIKSAISPFSPFQIHLATPEEYENWYQKFIKQDFVEI